MWNGAKRQWLNEPKEGRKRLGRPVGLVLENNDTKPLLQVPDFEKHPSGGEAGVGRWLVT